MDANVRKMLGIRNKIELETAERVRRHPAKIAEGTHANLRSIGEHATAYEERIRRQPIKHII